MGASCTRRSAVRLVSFPRRVARGRVVWVIIHITAPLSLVKLSRPSLVPVTASRGSPPSDPTSGTPMAPAGAATGATTPAKDGGGMGGGARAGDPPNGGGGPTIGCCARKGAAIGGAIIAGGDGSVDVSRVLMTMCLHLPCSKCWRSWASLSSGLGGIKKKTDRRREEGGEGRRARGRSQIVPGTNVMG